MADNLIGNENIFYNDDSNIVLIDPNTVVDSNGVPKSRTIKQENLVMYANLEAISVPRTKLAVGRDLDSGITNVLLADINFLKPLGKQTLDTSYTDEITGARSTQGSGVNQIKFGQGGANPQQTNFVDTQLLGIRDINVDIKFNGVPTVTMSLVDVQGRCLFQTGGNSPYSVFLYYPYPMFRLTLKGFYGKAIQYELMLLNFDATFEASTGNYIVNLKFISRTSAMLDDIRLAYLYALPHMFNTYQTSSAEIPNTSSTATASVQSTGVGNTQELTVSKTSKGYAKLRQVFETYKRRGLIDEDVPVLSVNEMSVKLSKYTEFLNKEFEKLPFENIVALERYDDSVDDFLKSIYSWENKYLNTAKPIILNETFQNVELKPLLNLQLKPADIEGELPANGEAARVAETALTKELETYYKIFNSVPGPLAKQVTINENDFKINFFKYKFTEDDIDWIQTYKRQTNGRRVENPNTDVAFRTFKQNLIRELSQNGTFIEISPPDPNKKISDGNPYYYSIDRELTNIKSIKGQLSQKRKQESDRLNNILKNKIKTNGNVSDLTFRPTVRNVIGVLMASVDAFYQMMDEVHTKAFEKRKDAARLKSIITNAPSQEGKGVVVGTRIQDPSNYVFPWPQFVQTKETDGKVEYEVTYPGAKDVKKSTQASNPNIWPEVEFVEEYLQAVLQKDRNFNNDVQPNDDVVINYTPEHAIEIPFRKGVYNQLQNPPINYIYEIYERLYLNAFYSGLLYINSNQNLELTILDMEFSNIQQSNPQGDLRAIITDTLSSQKLKDFLSTTTVNGVGGKLYNTFTAQQFVTPYIKEQVENSFGLLSPKDFKASSTNPIKLPSLNNISSLLKSTASNELSIFDTYPFRVETFFRTMEGSPTQDTLYTTINTYSFDNKKLVVSNYSGADKLRPYTRTNFSSSPFNNSTINNQTISNFYKSRFDLDPKFFTEGTIEYNNDSNVTNSQTTSMLNTPYFINAILEATDGDQVQDPISAAYLFLNSLPLSTMYEKYINITDGKKKDFIFAGLNKFSAIHEIPYAWVLKMGSVWHRYKKYIKTEKDILDNVWKDFDYKKAYDPETSNPGKAYQIPHGSSEVSREFKLVSDTGIKNGFYPKVINGFYKLLTNSNFFVDENGKLTYNLDNATATIGLELKVTTTPTTTPSGPITSYFCNLTVNNDYIALGTDYRGYKLLFPSAGHLPFQQSYFELRNETDQNKVTLNELKDSVPMYNGSVRCIWNAPNYGWFDNGGIGRPTPYEYIKFVNPPDLQQQDFSLGLQYSSIEDIFGVFTKKQLDEFEYEFLEFCKPGGESKIFKPEGEDTTFGNFVEILKKIFLIQTTEIDSAKIAEAQSAKLADVIQKFIEISVYMKIGNPKKFDRQQLGYFTKNDPNFIPSVKFDYGGDYSVTPDKLPNPTLSFADSRRIYFNEWNALYENVGFSTIEGTDNSKGISYGENSTVYDFFRDNNIPFSVSNIELLAPIIRIYATQKYLDNTLNSDKFAKLISETLQSVENKRSTIELMLRGKFPSLGDIVEVQVEQEAGSTLDGDIIKLEQWELFKSLNDKWVAGHDFINKKLLFEEFLFFDRANRDIGDELIINIDTIRRYCTWDNASTSIMSLIRELLSNNRMNFFVMPAYINFYGKSKDGQSIVNNANDVFGVYNYVDFTSFAPKFLCQYIDRPSQTLSMDDDPNYPFKDDGFDMGNPTNNPIRQIGTQTNFDRNNKAVGFVVDFGTINQSIFKSVDINQQQGVSSSEQIQATIDLGNQGAGKKTMQQTTALYEFYKNRSYNSSIKTLGNVMIQPTMYFVLRHVPMFNGTYIIREVKHTISPGSFNTSFEGQRISANINTRINDDLASVNEDFTKKLNDKVKQFVTNNELVTFSTTEERFLTGQSAKNVKLNSKIPYLGFINNASDSPNQDCFENVNVLFGTLSGQTLTESSIAPRDLIALIKKAIDAKSINQNTFNGKFFKYYLFSLVYLQGYPTNNISTKLKYKMNNLYGVITDVDTFKSELPKQVKDCRCLKSIDGTTRPFASFVDISKNIDFMVSYYKEKIDTSGISTDPNLFTNPQILEKIYDLMIKLFYETWYTSGPTNVVKKYNEDKNQYDDWKSKVKWAVSQGLALNL